MLLECMRKRYGFSNGTSGRIDIQHAAARRSNPIRGLRQTRITQILASDALH